MPIQLDSYSRFRETTPIITKGPDGQAVETFGLWKTPTFLGSIDPTEVFRIKVDSRRAGRPDLISNDVYGSPVYFWVLIAHNKPQNILGWPQINDIIEAPMSQVVLGSL